MRLSPIGKSLARGLVLAKRVIVEKPAAVLADGAPRAAPCRRRAPAAVTEVTQTESPDSFQDLAPEHFVATSNQNEVPGRPSPRENLMQQNLVIRIGCTVRVTVDTGTRRMHVWGKRQQQSMLLPRRRAPTRAKRVPRCARRLARDGDGAAGGRAGAQDPAQVTRFRNVDVCVCTSAATPVTTPC